MTPVIADSPSERSARDLGIRAAFGGFLMGLANLVPGISGGTMLLAAGVYPEFISAVADVTTLKFRRQAIVMLGSIVITAAMAILLLAGVVRSLVIEHRWVMYSVFVGLTLGGAPLVWRLARPVTGAVFVGAAGGLAVMLLMVMTGDLGGGSQGSSYMLLVLAGLAGASAMILPGISGGYLLLLLGQYEPILGAIDSLKVGLLGGAGRGAAPGLEPIMGALGVLVPLGIGVVIGVVAVSNLLQWLLRNYRSVTLGGLLGLLLGAVVGLWPFQQGVAPVPGDEVNGVVLTASGIAALDPADWPVEFFGPTTAQVLAALALVGLGLGLTLAIDRLGSRRPIPAESFGKAEPTAT